ncbi:hypothetical protein [Massilia pseudoviolaceinigra]|uniref:hypothetical protein n=1 Tax=Massilia pseudoviolaceinigra TaxID=3057165 RepID=UPI00279679AB|nr:hypothetical protein [Massilia sp. CCM 9206]MDQ1920029.1 hypothetical protein [Massilia sp. CCM 9206]
MPAPATSETIAASILAGTLPSVVLRSVLAQSPELDHYQAARLLHYAFRGAWLIKCGWKWKFSENSDVFDTEFDLCVIRRLIDAGAGIPWDLPYCESEYRRVGPALEESARLALLAAREAVSYERLCERLEAMDDPLVCVQALWDGDTDGWFLGLDCIVRANGKLETIWLGTIPTDGDIRLFNGTVPPWPEAEHANVVGRRLAEKFNIEFYFPAPDTPDDTLPGWQELHA